jgi:hypothetical protein
VRLIENPDGVLLLDAVIEEKPSTDENELISWRYDHSHDRNVKGINFLTAAYEAGGVCLPVAFDLVTKTVPYVGKKSGKQKRKSAITKNDATGCCCTSAFITECSFASCSTMSGSPLPRT